MSGRWRVFLLIMIMAGIALGVGGITLQALYQTALDQQRARLVETAHSQARLIEEMARYYADVHVVEPGNAMDATLIQLREAHTRFEGFGKTGEFTLAERQGDQIVFLLSHRHYDLDDPEPVPFVSDWAEPMRRALSGESGTVIDLDYRGETVLAAYEPVAELDLGIVAKIDLAEVQAPFINAGLLAGAGAIILIGLGSALFLRVSNPLLRQLEENERKYRTLFESANDSIFIVNSATRQFLDVNQKAAERLGYTRAELLNLKFDDISAPKVAIHNDALLQELRDTGSILFEHIHQCKDGTLVPVEISSRFVQVGNQSIHQSIVRDIAERKQAEETLRQSEERYKRLVESIADGVFVLNYDWEYVLINDAAERLAQIPKAQLLGGNVFDLAPAFADSTFFQTMKRVMATREAETLINEYEIDGAPVWYEVRVFPFPEGILCLSRDITERRKANDALRESEERFRQIAENISESFWMADIEKATLLYLSPAYETIWGHPREEVFADPSTWVTRIHPDDREWVLNLVKEHIAGKTTDVEYRIIRPDGELRWMHDRAFPIFDDQGQVYRVTGLSEDITERRQAEETLHQYAAEQAMLYGITSAVTVSLDPERLCVSALDVALTVLDAEAGWITLLGTTPGNTPSIIQRGLPDTFSSSALQSCLTCNSLSLDSEADYSGVSSILYCAELSPAFGSDFIPQRYVCVPLIAGGRVLAMMTLVSLAADATFGENHLLLKTIGHQIAIALHNAQLYQTARQMDRLRALNELDRVLMGAALDQREIMVAALQQIAAAVNAPRGMLIKPLTEENQLLLFTPERGWYGGRVPADLAANWQALWLSMQNESATIRFAAKEITSMIGLSPVLVARWGAECLLVCLGHDSASSMLLVLGGRALDNPFVKDDQALVQVAVSRANQALRNAQLYEAEQEQRMLAEALHDTAAALNSTLNFDEVLDHILANVGRVVRHDQVQILLIEDREAYLVRGYSASERETYAETKAQRFPLATTHNLRQVVETKQPVVIADVRDYPEWVWFPGEDWVRSHISTPICIDDEIIGLLNLKSAIPNEFVNIDANRLQTFAHQAAIAIQNAQLYDELKVLLREQEETQSRLIHSEKTAALGRLTASIAHEINNPIQAVQGCLSLVQNELTGRRREDKLNQYLAVVEDEINRVATIVKRMRDFYRPIIEEFQAVDVHAILSSVIALMETQLVHSGVVVEPTWDDEMPLVQAKPGYLRQVFLNLVLNANDAMREGGTLRIRTERVQPPFHAHLAHPAVRIEFDDTGEGIAPADLEQLFEPFFTTREQGSGLGLSISNDIIEAHHGQIGVESQIGVGTTFTILLPVEQPISRSDDE